jgi:hypothetical protein
LLNYARRVPKRNRIHEIEIAPWLDQREIHVRRPRIGNDSLDLRHGKVAPRFGHLARLIIDYPIANTGLNAAEILTGKMIALGGTVVVNRV